MNFDARRRFDKPQLVQVICQLRFPEILSIEANLPVAFQEMIRKDFPNYSVRKEAPAPKLAGTPGNMTVQSQQLTNNYQFTSPVGTWRVNLTSRFLSLSCSRYTTWEEFAKKLDLPLVALIKTYQPAYFERVGLRYMNAISRKDLHLESVPFRDLIEPSYLGVLAREDVQETATTRSSYDLEMRLRGDVFLKLHAGPGMIRVNNVPEQEVRFILDNDLYMSGNIPVPQCAGAVSTLHQHADRAFLDAITEELYDALDPQEFL